MSTPATGGTPGDPISEVTPRRDRMQSTLEELQRVVELDDAGDGVWHQAAVAALAGATATWERHVAGTEDPQGILADVAEREPRLTHQVETLRVDHAEIRALLDETNVALPTQDPVTAREGVQAVAMRLSHHHHLGGELIHSAYEVELGGDG